MKLHSKLIILFFILTSCSRVDGTLKDESYLKAENEVISFLFSEEILHQDALTKDSANILITVNDTLINEPHGSNTMVLLSADSIFKPHFKKLDSDIQANLNRLGSKYFSQRIFDCKTIGYPTPFILANLSQENKFADKKFRTKGTVTFSRVALNNKLDRACVYFESNMHYDWTDMRDAGGTLYLLEKENGQWKITYHRVMWAV